MARRGMPRMMEDTAGGGGGIVAEVVRAKSMQIKG